MKQWLNKWRSLHRNALGINERNLRLVYPLNKREHFHLADDKILTKSILSQHDIPVAEQIAVIDRIGNIAQKWADANKRSCAIKPSKGRGGGGILVIDRRDDRWYKGDRIITDEEIHRHMANIVFGVYSFGNDDRVLVEEKISSHPDFLEIYPKGVADLRLIVKEGELLQAMLRVPTAASGGRANLHQGAIGIGIDLATGMTTGGYDGNHYLDVHPDSGAPLKGLQVPDWELAKDITRRTFEAFPLGYLGVDIAYDASKGPLVLEINVRPGLEIQNVNRQGLRQYLK
jgi:alpha-L-glutamate ligase-like protein